MYTTNYIIVLLTGLSWPLLLHLVNQKFLTWAQNKNSHSLQLLYLILCQATKISVFIVLVISLHLSSNHLTTFLYTSIASSFLYSIYIKITEYKQLSGKKNLKLKPKHLFKHVITQFKEKEHCTL